MNSTLALALTVLSTLYFKYQLKRLNAAKSKVELRLTVSRPVCLGVRHPSGTRNQFATIIFKITFRYLGVC
jgi:hypothetical protein